MTKTSSTKEIILGDLLSTLSTNKIPDLSDSPRSAGKILNINKTPFKLTGNIPSKEH